VEERGLLVGYWGVGSRAGCWETIAGVPELGLHLFRLLGAYVLIVVKSFFADDLS
jgi:hypothetical protein